MVSGIFVIVGMFSSVASIKDVIYQKLIKSVNVSLSYTIYESGILLETHGL